MDEYTYADMMINHAGRVQETTQALEREVQRFDADKENRVS